MTLNATAVYSGVSSATLSDMMNKDHVPKVEILFKLADYFNTPRNRVLELAGYLQPEQKRDNDHDQRLVETAERLIEVWEVLLKLDPQAAENLLRIAVMQAEMVKAAALANEQRREAENTNTTS